MHVRLAPFVSGELEETWDMVLMMFSSAYQAGRVCIVQCRNVACDLSSNDKMRVDKRSMLTPHFFFFHPFS